MTTDTDKLVEMAQASSDYRLSSGAVIMGRDEITAFASAHIASLCGDVEPDVYLRWEGDGQFGDYVVTNPGNGYPFVDASTVAALKARVAELESAVLEGARRIESLKRECSDPESPIAIQNGRYMNVSYFLRAALTKGQP